MDPNTNQPNDDDSSGPSALACAASLLVPAESGGVGSTGELQSEISKATKELKEPLPGLFCFLISSFGISKKMKELLVSRYEFFMSVMVCFFPIVIW